MCTSGALEGAAVGARLRISPHTPCAEEQLLGHFGTRPALPRPGCCGKWGPGRSWQPGPTHGCPVLCRLRWDTGSWTQLLLLLLFFNFSPPDPLI